MGLLLNPTVLLATLLVAGYVSIFHLWTGRSTRDLLVFLIAAGVGFALGQWIGRSLQWDILWDMRIGQLYILEATIVSVLALFLVKILNL